jgi:hypothetical protein
MVTSATATTTAAAWSPTPATLTLHRLSTVHEFFR